MLASAAAVLAVPTRAPAQRAAFAVEESTIADVQAAIRDGRTTCAGVVEAYLERVRAYNGVCTALVTADGAPVAPARGYVRAGRPIEFPTQTVAIAEIAPDFDRYSGKPPDFGRMEPTSTDPGVMQQFGIVRGIAGIGQVNALETLNVRGERSQVCAAECDLAPSAGPLPGHCPTVCDAFREQPDALEYARELDSTFGTEPDLDAMPLYCTVMSVKAVYDTSDMRSTGGGDVAYAMDAAPTDSTLVSRLRRAGAVIFAKAHNSEYNGGSGDPGGAHEVARPMIGAGGSRETWGGATCNPYDTERETGGSSGGSAVSVAASFVACSICESTGGSCRSPGTHNGVATFVPMKGMISYGGGIGADPYRDRPGIQCRSVGDAATVFDAFRDPETGFFDARDPYTALSRPAASAAAYVDALAEPSDARPLAGMRIGVVRELMVSKNPGQDAIVDAIDRELAVLAGLGAELVESTGPAYTDDPNIPNMDLSFEDAMAEVIPYHLPEVLSWRTPDGELEFAIPGYDVTSREYLVAVTLHEAPWPANLDFARIFGNPPDDDDAVSGYGFSFQLAQYLAERDDAKVGDWETLNANAKYFNNVRETAMHNWGEKAIDVRTSDLTFTMKRRDAMRLVVLKVMEQNAIDVFVNPPLVSLPAKLAGATDPDRRNGGHGHGARLGAPEVFVPAGFATTIYEPELVLSEDGEEYDSVPGTTPTSLAQGLPFNIGFWGGQGDEAVVLKVASAYELATRHRQAPAEFGPVAGVDRRTSRAD